MKTRRLQIVVSLILAVTGSIVAGYYAGQLSGRMGCDNRYRDLIEEIDKQVNLKGYFVEKGHEEYLVRVFSFYPSGWKFGYGGKREDALFMIAGGAIALFGIAGTLDICRRSTII